MKNRNKLWKDWITALDTILASTEDEKLLDNLFAINDMLIRAWNQVEREKGTNGWVAAVSACINWLKELEQEHTTLQFLGLRAQLEANHKELVKVAS